MYSTLELLYSTLSRKKLRSTALKILGCCLGNGTKAYELERSVEAQSTYVYSAAGNNKCLANDVVKRL